MGSRRKSLGLKSSIGLAVHQIRGGGGVQGKKQILLEP